MIAPLLLLPLAALPPGRLALEIRSPQRSVLTAEPVKLVVTWKAFWGPIKGVSIEGEDFLHGSVVFDVKGPRGKATYREFRKVVCGPDVLVPTDLAAGEEVMRNLVLTEGFYLRMFGEAIPEFLFEEPGRYSVRAVYVREGRRLAESNALRFEVSEPTGAEADVAAVVREQPNIMGPGGHPGILEKRRELLEKYPDSRYLKWARLQLLWVKDSELRNDLRLRPSRSAEYLALAQEAERGDWGPFEEDALALALLAAANGGDDVLHQRLRKTLLERHPKSAWARYVRRSK